MVKNLSCVTCAARNVLPKDFLEAGGTTQACPHQDFVSPVPLESIRVREDTYNDNLWGTNRNNFVDSTLDSSGLVVRVPNCGRADGQNCSYQCYQRATGCWVWFGKIFDQFYK